MTNTESAAVNKARAQRIFFVENNRMHFLSIEIDPGAISSLKKNNNDKNKLLGDFPEEKKAIRGTSAGFIIKNWGFLRGNPTCVESGEFL